MSALSGKVESPFVFREQFSGRFPEFSHFLCFDSRYGTVLICLE